MNAASAEVTEPVAGIRAQQSCKTEVEALSVKKNDLIKEKEQILSDIIETVAELKECRNRSAIAPEQLNQYARRITTASNRIDAVLSALSQQLAGTEEEE